MYQEHHRPASAATTLITAGVVGRTEETPVTAGVQRISQQCKPAHLLGNFRSWKETGVEEVAVHYSIEMIELRTRWDGAEQSKRISKKYTIGTRDSMHNGNIACFITGTS
jgi:hypothetical protein